MEGDEMQLNEIHTEHEHASTSLKVILLIFALVLVGALAYLVYQQNANPVDSGGDTVKSPAKSSTTTTKTAPTADWKTFTATNYSYEYPTTSTAPTTKDVTEGDVSWFTAGKLTYTVSLHSNPKNKTTIEEWLKDNQSLADLSAYTKTTVGSETAYTWTGYLDTFVMHNGVVYELLGHEGIPPVLSASDATFSHFVSSFKFL